MNTVVALNGGNSEALVEDTKLRVMHAVDIADKLHATSLLNRIIMAGHEAAEMFDFAYIYHQQMFPESEPLPMEYDNSSSDTIGNAHFTKINRHLDPNTDPNIQVVTVNWHSPRSRWIFRRVLGEDYGISTNPSVNPYNRLQTAKHMTSEIAAFGLCEAILFGLDAGDDEQREHRLLKLHPRYS